MSWEITGVDVSCIPFSLSPQANQNTYASTMLISLWGSKELTASSHSTGDKEGRESWKPREIEVSGIQLPLTEAICCWLPDAGKGKRQASCCAQASHRYLWELRTGPDGSMTFSNRLLLWSHILTSRQGVVPWHSLGRLFSERENEE